MKTVYKILMICFLLTSCSSDDDLKFKVLCSVDNPTTDLPWLKAEIEAREQNVTEFSRYLYISQAIHKGEAIIIYADCCPVCNSVYVVYNCRGENIGFIGDGNFTLETLSSGKVIWKTDDNSCSF